MADNSAIEWTEATWNPVTGCDKVSPGCAHCYAETFAERWRGVPGHPYEQGFDLRLWPQRLEQPLRWKRPRHDLRQLDERPVPRGHPRRASSQHVFDVMGRAELAHLPDPHQAPRAPRRAGADRCRGRRTSGWASRSRTAASSTAPTTCARCRPPCGSSPPSRCSDRSTASTSTGIDWLIAGGESGPRHRPMRRRVGPRPARPLRRRGRRVLLQAVGRPNPEGGRPRARRPDVGRDA